MTSRIRVVRAITNYDRDCMTRYVAKLGEESAHRGAMENGAKAQNPTARG
jgi:hypothetical protein